MSLTSYDVIDVVVMRKLDQNSFCRPSRDKMAKNRESRIHVAVPEMTSTWKERLLEALCPLS
jgi:hypothetical protein